LKDVDEWSAKIGSTIGDMLTNDFAQGVYNSLWTVTGVLEQFCKMWYTFKSEFEMLSEEEEEAPANA